MKLADSFGVYPPLEGLPLDSGKVDDRSEIISLTTCVKTAPISRSNVKSDIQDVSVPDDVILAFQSE